MIHEAGPRHRCLYVRIFAVVTAGIRARKGLLEGVGCVLTVEAKKGE